MILAGWKGTLMSEGIGLASCLASASALAAPPVVGFSGVRGETGV